MQKTKLEGFKMNINKSAIAIALTTILGTTSTQADTIDMGFTGLFTLLDSSGIALTNTSQPYYYDTTWGYGRRTQISGTLQYNTVSKTGSVDVNPYGLLAAPDDTATITDFDFKFAGSNLLIANMFYDWNGNNFAVQVVLDGSGLFAEINAGVTTGDIFDATTCAASGACATPASNGIPTPPSLGPLPIGPALIATTSINTTGQTGISTTLAQLSLGTDDGIGGSPQDNGPTLGFYSNFDFTNITVTNVSAVPVPAAVWLFGSGLLGLASITRRKSRRI